jgi:hypothetical protein
MRCRAGPCSTSEVECWRSPGRVMVPRDFRDEHPCNLTLQSQMPDQMTQDGTTGHWRALEGTPWTADRPRDFFSSPWRAPGPSPPMLLRTCSAGRQAWSRPSLPSARTPADASGQHRTTTYNSALHPTPTYKYSTPHLPTNHPPKPTSHNPNNPLYLTRKPQSRETRLQRGCGRRARGLDADDGGRFGRLSREDCDGPGG